MGAQRPAAGGGGGQSQQGEEEGPRGRVALDTQGRQEGERYRGTAHSEAGLRAARGERVRREQPHGEQIVAGRRSAGAQGSDDTELHQSGATDAKGAGRAGDPRAGRAEEESGGRRDTRGDQTLPAGALRAVQSQRHAAEAAAESGPGGEQETGVEAQDQPRGQRGDRTLQETDPREAEEGAVDEERSGGGVGVSTGEGESSGAAERYQTVIQQTLG